LTSDKWPPAALLTNLPRTVGLKMVVHKLKSFLFVPLDFIARGKNCLRFQLLTAKLSFYSEYIIATNKIHTYTHTTHVPTPKGQQRHLRYSSETTFYQNHSTMRNTADVSGGKLIAV
jgi:hypothetical protein